MSNFPTTPQLLGLVDEIEHDFPRIGKELFDNDETLTGTYSFDVVEGNAHAATHRNDSSPANVQKMTTRNRVTVDLPNLREKKQIPSHIVKLFDGAGQAKPERVAKIFTRELADLDLLIERRHEIDMWALLTTGIITLTGDLSGQTLDFGLNSNLTVSPTTAWSSVSSSTPLKDLSTWKQLLRRYSGGQEPAKCYISSTGMSYLMESTDSKAYFSDAICDLWFKEGIAPKVGNMQFKIVDHGYTTEAGTFTRFLPEAKMVMVPEGKVGTFVQGPAVDNQAPDDHLGKFSKIWSPEDPAGHWLLLTQKAMAGLTKANSVLCATLYT